MPQTTGEWVCRKTPGLAPSQGAPYHMCFINTEICHLSKLTSFKSLGDKSNILLDSEPKIIPICGRFVSAFQILHNKWRATRRMCLNSLCVIFNVFMRCNRDHFETWVDYSLLVRTSTCAVDALLLNSNKIKIIEFVKDTDNTKMSW